MRQTTPILPLDTDAYKKALLCARHYGFSPFDAIFSSDTKTKPGKKDSLVNPYPQTIDSLNGALTHAIATLAKEEHLEESMLFYSIHPYALGKKKTYSFTLYILGAENTLAETLLLRVGSSVCEEMGIKDSEVHINPVGDKDSQAKFFREAIFHMKRNAEHLPIATREMLKSDPTEAVISFYRSRHPLLESLPRTIECLSTHSRKHFHNLLEVLESSSIHYELDDTLIGNKDCYTHTLFALTTSGSTSPTYHARGGRCDEFSQKFFKRHLPAVGLSFSFSQLDATAIADTKTRMKNPEAFFIHIGRDAQLKSLEVIETLRRARVPFLHTLSGGSFSDHLTLAEKKNVPYAIIMGQREAIIDSVIIRKVDTRSQDLVPIQAIPQYFRAQRFGVGTY